MLLAMALFMRGEGDFLKNQKLKGNLMLLMTAFVWGVSFIFQSKGVETLSACAFNGIRSILGGIVLLPVIYLIDQNKKKRGENVYKIDKKLIKAGVICGIFLCLASTIQSMGMVYTSPGKAGFITALYMVMVPITGLFMGKKPSKAVVFAVMVAVVGLYLMCVEKGAGINKGDILVFICSILFSIHIMVIDHYSPMVDGVKLACLQFFVCGIINVLYMLIFEEVYIDKILDNWINIGYAGVFSCGVAYTLQIVGQKYTDPTSASILMSLESVFSTLSTVVLVALGFNLTGGALNAREIFGCILMFAAIMLVQLPDNKISKKKTKEIA